MSLRSTTWRWMAAVLVGLVGLAVTLHAEEPAPRLVLRQGQVVLTTLPPVLAEPEVRRHLDTGLTTNLVLRLRGRSGALRGLTGEALVELRYELWDEVFLVASTGTDGRRRPSQLASFDELLAWWRQLELPLAELPAGAAGAELEVELHVLPFSSSEQRDTQRWFSDSLNAPGTGAAADVPAGAKEPQPLKAVLNLLMATSIERREVLRFTWTVPLDATQRGEPP